jgi:hypothetical protein
MYWDPLGYTRGKDEVENSFAGEIVFSVTHTWDVPFKKTDFVEISKVNHTLFLSPEIANVCSSLIKRWRSPFIWIIPLIRFMPRSADI